MRSSLIVVDAEVKRAQTNDAETARDALALCPALLLVLCKIRLVQIHAGGGKGVDTEPKGVGIEPDGVGKLCGDATCESKVSTRNFFAVFLFSQVTLPNVVDV